MGVMIKGMEMPTTCGSCWFCHAVSNEKWHCRLTGKSFASYSVGWGNENNTGENGQHPYIRRDDCPLVPVPETHGRLISADELIEFIENRYEITWKDDYEGGIKDACVDVLEKISTMPTVIPASEEECNGAVY